MPDCITFGDWLIRASTRLRDANKSTPELDARLLLEAVTGFDHPAVISRSKEKLENKVAENLDQLLDRRLSGEPVHRILGCREFYGRRFLLSPDTLVPRPETEILVECVINALDNRTGPIDILDLGTGSGAIAVTLAGECPKANVLATDISDCALKTALKNAQTHGLTENIKFLNSDVFESVSGIFDFIVSNPPYIPGAEIDRLQVEVAKHDPHAALCGGEDGLCFYRQIFQGASVHLKENGKIIVEIGAGQKNAVAAIAKSSDFIVEDVIADLSGIDRVLVSAKS